MQPQNQPSHYEVEFIPIERRLYARRKADRSPGNPGFRRGPSPERRRLERRQSA